MRYRSSDFDYVLPANRIAQHPLPDRAASRLLVLERSTGAIRHLHFRDVVALVPAGALLVLNSSRVIPARLHGKRDTPSGAEGMPAHITLIYPFIGGSVLTAGNIREARDVLR